MKKLNKGVFIGISAGIMWAITTLLSESILSLNLFKDTSFNPVFNPLVAIFFSDLVGMIVLLCYFILKGDLKKLFKIIKNKNFKYIILVGLAGGPIGMGGYYLSIRYLGSSYASAISSIYPIITAILSVVFLKNKLKLKAWFGLILAIMGVILLTVTKISMNINMIGFIFAIFPALGWGAESILCGKAIKDDSISPIQVLFMRFLISVIIDCIFIFPFTRGFVLMHYAFTDTNLLIILVVNGLLYVTGLSLYFSCIKYVGPIKATIYNMTYVVWALILGVLFLGKVAMPNKLISILIILFGSILVVLSKE